MDDEILSFYRMSDIAKYEDIHLLSLRDNCAAMEDRLEAVKERMPEHDRQILECYLDIRNDLEYETFKTALRWGRDQHA